MSIAICTLFEGSYHYGVAGLVNSLCRSGFKGTVYAGYRGELPGWVKDGTPVSCGSQVGMSFHVADGVNIVFLLLDTNYHLTNYKPKFMLDLFDTYCVESDALCYVDPDIIINKEWQFFQEWMTCGIALCEDINSPLPVQNPRRVGWRRFFETHGIILHPGEISYANGGFVGVRKADREFLERWHELTLLMLDYLGGNDIVGITGGRHVKAMGFAECFGKTDQDVLNATLEALPRIPASFESRRAMAFDPGENILPHALGADKPWNVDYVRRIAKQGRGPTPPDKAFWDAVDGPIAVFPPAVVSKKRKQIRLASAIGRFYRRS